MNRLACPLNCHRASESELVDSITGTFSYKSSVRTGTLTTAYYDTNEPSGLPSYNNVLASAVWVLSSAQSEEEGGGRGG
jgi:hypothetical protein